MWRVDLNFEVVFRVNGVIATKCDLILFGEKRIVFIHNITFFLYISDQYALIVILINIKYIKKTHIGSNSVEIYILIQNN